MTYSAKAAIGLHVKNVPHDIREAFTERAARALVFHGGNDVVRKYNNRHDGDAYGEWARLLEDVRTDMKGHYIEDIIAKAEFELR